MTAKVLIFSQGGTSTGFGRIADEVALRLATRGYQIHSASRTYDGLLPGVLDDKVLPYHTAPIGTDAGWPERLAALAATLKPDIILVIEDAPFAVAVRHTKGIDWSQHKFAVITPVDGAPISPDWLSTVNLEADGAMTISQFGVDAFAEAGVQVDLCRPGIDPNYFYELRLDERLALRTKLGLPPNTFVVGTMAMNHGRKLIPHMMRAFFEFCRDKPNAAYYLDMDELNTSGAGWHLSRLCQQYGWDIRRLMFKRNVGSVFPELRDRYNLLDVQMLISEREGYGLPLVESMACGAIAMAQDYCSGREICGDGRGLLAKTIDYEHIGTWGGAVARLPDHDHMVALLNKAYTDLAWRSQVKEAGKEWARRHTWDNTADQVDRMLQRVMMGVGKRGGVNIAPTVATPLPPAPPSSDAPPAPQPAVDDHHNERSSLIDVGGKTYEQRGGELRLVEEAE